MLPEINLDNSYLVMDQGTSDGTQIKYFDNGKWYKVDRYGGEGAAEELVSKVLELSGFPTDKYVQYSQIIINGEPGCCSQSFLNDANESFITFYRIYSNLTGNDLITVTSRMDYDDAIEYVLDFMKTNTGLDLREYLANTFVLDALILNEDRHFNNFGLIYDGTTFREAPIFDNGKSLFVGNKRYDLGQTMEQNKKIAFAKSFSGSFDLNLRYLQKYATLKIDYAKVGKYLEKQDLATDNVYSRLYKLLKNN